MKKLALLLFLCLVLVLTFSCGKKPPPGDLFGEDEPIIIEEEEEGELTEEMEEMEEMEEFVEEEEVEEEVTEFEEPPPPTPSIVYRVQVGAFYSNAGANKRKTRASSLFNKPVYVEYIAPYYKVRVGDFASKSEAESYKSVVRSYFFDAFVAEATP